MTHKDNEEFAAGVGDTITKKRTKKTIINVLGCFHDDQALNGLFRYNEFSSRIELAKAPPWHRKARAGDVLKDEDLVYLKYYLGKHFKFEPPVALIMESITQAASTAAYHPVRAYLQGLTWDGTKRLDTWLSLVAGAEDNAYTRCVARKAICAAVKRVFEPGCEFQAMTILEGLQGTGKSSLIKTLAHPWFAELSFVERDKDIIDAMQGKWIIEIDELGGFKREDVERIKAFISHNTDRARLAYRRITDEFPRQSIFIGTLNPEGENTYFRDNTGNRRFWPVVCGKIDLAYLREFKDQIFAEAQVVLKAGEALYLDDQDAVGIAGAMQAERLQIDPWLPLVAEFLNKQTNLFGGISFIDIAKHLEIKTDRLTKNEQTRIGIILKHLGYISHRVMKNGTRERVYYPEGKEPEFE